MIPWERVTDFYSVCIDSTENYVYQGRLYHRYLCDSLPFQNLDHLMFQINDCCNQIGFPETWEGFRNKKMVGLESENRIMEAPVHENEIRTKQGKKATFWVVIIRRQFNTWQGEVFWKEQKKAGRFNSITEFLTLLAAASEQAICCTSEGEGAR